MGVHEDGRGPAERTLEAGRTRARLGGAGAA